MKDNYTGEEIITAGLYGHYGPLDSPKFIQELNESEYDIRIFASVSDSRDPDDATLSRGRSSNHRIDIPFDSKQDGLTEIDNLLKNLKTHHYISLYIWEFVRS